MSKFKEFTEKHAEIWKFIKFTFAGTSSSIVQYAVDVLIHYVVFAGLKGQTVDNAVFRFLGIDSQMDAAYAYFVAATVGYAVAFIMNRKVTFQANNGLTAGIVIYIIMVVATIFITAWMKGVFFGFAVEKGYDNAFVDFLIDLAVIIIPFVWTYPLQRFVIHKKSVPADEATEEAKTEVVSE